MTSAKIYKTRKKERNGKMKKIRTLEKLNQKNRLERMPLCVNSKWVPVTTKMQQGEKRLIESVPIIRTFNFCRAWSMPRSIFPRGFLKKKI